MSALQKQGTFQVYLTTLDINNTAEITNGMVTVPVQLSGDYHLRINGVSLIGTHTPFLVDKEDSIYNKVPEPLFIQSAEFSSSLSNIQGICICPHVITLVPWQSPKFFEQETATLRLQQYQQTRYDFSARLTGSLTFFLSVNQYQRFTDNNLYPNTNVFDNTTRLWAFDPVIVLDISYKRTDTGFFDA